MDLTSRQRIGAVVLIISGIAAFAAPFLIHSPPIQGGTATNNNDNNNGGTGNQGTGGGGGQGAGPKKSMQDLMNAIGSCQAESHGNSESHGKSKASGYTRSLQNKVQAAIRTEDPARADHHLAVLEHKLSTPSAERHAGACIDELKDLIDELRTSS